MSSGMREIYHGTFDSWADDIIKNGFRYPNINETDDHWLGHGIYFYPYFSSALYWARNKVKAFKKNGKGIYKEQVIKAQVNEQLICDLDEYKNYKKYIDFCHEIDKNLSKYGIELDFSKGLDKNISINIAKRKRCMFTDLFVSKHNIKGLMFTFNVHSQQNNKSVFLLMGRNERQICIYDKTIIKNCVKCYNIHEEYNCGKSIDIKEEYI